MPVEQLPSQTIIDRIHQLEPVNASPTQFIGMTSATIAQFVISDLSGRMVIDVGKAPEAERQPIREAITMRPQGHEGPFEIKILGDSDSPESIGVLAEDQILREIDKEVISSPIGMAAFRRFLEKLFKDPIYRPLVNTEWVKYLVGHEVSGKVNSPFETHHFHNVGLKTRSEGDDSLRDEVVIFVRQAVETVRESAEVIFQNPEVIRHKSPEMNEPDNRLLALGMAEFSNFVRGGILYRYRDGEHTLSRYKPREIAAQTIDEVTRKINSAEPA